MTETLLLKHTDAADLRRMTDCVETFESALRAQAAVRRIVNLIGLNPGPVHGIRDRDRSGQG